jgi:ribosomal protein S18 acetylase RimI-like enzyme
MIQIPLSKIDFKQIAIIHKSELIGEGLLSQCSIRFLSMFYQWMSKSKKSFVLIEKSNSEIVNGFIFCVKNKNIYYRDFFYNNILKLLVYPEFFFQIIITFHKKRIKFIPYDAELTQIAVKSLSQGKGIASKLIAAAEEEFIKRGIFEYYLQVEENNINAVNLYKKLHFIIVDENKNDKIKKYLMKKILTNKII